MSIIGTQQITAPIAPTSITDTYASHFDYYGFRGYRVVDNAAERLAITTERRGAGMWVNQLDTGIIYELNANLITWFPRFFSTAIQSIYNEIPTLDVTRTIFTLANNYVPGSIRLYVGTTRMTPGVGFTETAPNQGTFPSPLPPGESILADYDKL